MSRYLITSDWHLTDAPRDEYRWDLFRWLKIRAESKKVDAILILGDITDRKDHHSNAFINRMVDAFFGLAEACPVVMLRGNHDCSDPADPLFRFLREEPVIFFHEPTIWRDCALVPHHRDIDLFGKAVRKVAASAPGSLLLIHQTINGSIAESGVELKGIEPKVIRRSASAFAACISGDVHVPQRIGEVVYCGSPHPIRFGDSFQPRVLFWDDGALKSIPRTTIKKRVLRINEVDELDGMELTEQDQAKVVLTLPRSEFGAWQEYRREIIKRLEARQVIVVGIELRERERSSKKEEAFEPETRATPRKLLKRFCRASSIDQDLRAVGESLLP